MDGASGCAEAGESWHASLSFLSAATAETSQVRSELAAQIRWLLGWKHDRHDTIGVAYHHIGVGPWEEVPSEPNVPYGYGLRERHAHG